MRSRIVLWGLLIPFLLQISTTGCARGGGSSVPTAGYYDPECIENARRARIDGVQACMSDSRPFQCESDVEQLYQDLRRGCWVQ